MGQTCMEPRCPRLAEAAPGFGAGAATFAAATCGGQTQCGGAMTCCATCGPVTCGGQTHCRCTGPITFPVTTVPQEGCGGTISAVDCCPSRLCTQAGAATCTAATCGGPQTCAGLTRCDVHTCTPATCGGPQTCAGQTHCDVHTCLGTCAGPTCAGQTQCDAQTCTLPTCGQTCAPAFAASCGIGTCSPTCGPRCQTGPICAARPVDVVARTGAACGGVTHALYCQVTFSPQCWISEHFSACCPHTIAFCQTAFVNCLTPPVGLESVQVCANTAHCAVDAEVAAPTVTFATRCDVVTCGGATRCGGVHTCAPVTCGPATCGWHTVCELHTCALITCGGPTCGGIHTCGPVTCGGATRCGGIFTCGPEGEQAQAGFTHGPLTHCGGVLTCGPPTSCLGVTCGGPTACGGVYTCRC